MLPNVSTGSIFAERASPARVRTRGASIEALRSAAPGRIRLRNGRSIRVRSATPADGEALERLHRSLSRESRYLRYFSPHGQLSDVELHHFTHPDGHDHVSLLALAGERAVGHALYDRLDGSDEAELAIEVADDWQGQGLGTELCKELARRAKRAGFRRLVAFVLPENRKMRAMLRDIDLGKESAFEHGVVAFHLDLGEARPRTIGMLQRSRAVVISLVGGSLALIGVALLVLPGPGWAFIAAGLSVLAAEFSWSRRWLRRIEQEARRGLDWVRAEPAEAAPEPGHESGSPDGGKQS